MDLDNYDLNAMNVYVILFVSIISSVHIRGHYLLTGGGVEFMNWINYLFRFLYAELYLSQVRNLFRFVCVY